MQTYNQVAIAMGNLWENTLCGIGVSEDDVVIAMLMATDTELRDAVIVGEGSFRPKDGSNGDGSDFHCQTRKNDTHQNTTDPDSRLYRKAAGRAARLCYMGHVVMESRHRLAVAGLLRKATGTAERRVMAPMLVCSSSGSPSFNACVFAHTVVCAQRWPPLANTRRGFLLCGGWARYH